MDTLELGKTYICDEPVCGYFLVGDEVTPCTEKGKDGKPTGEVVRGANHPDLIMCCKPKQPGKGLFVDPKQVHAA